MSTNAKPEPKSEPQPKEDELFDFGGPPIEPQDKELEEKLLPGFHPREGTKRYADR